MWTSPVLDDDGLQLHLGAEYSGRAKTEGVLRRAKDV